MKDALARLDSGRSRCAAIQLAEAATGLIIAAHEAGGLWIARAVGIVPFSPRKAWVIHMTRRWSHYTVAALALASAACSGPGGQDPPDVDTPPSTPAGLTATPGDGRVDLAWTPNPEPDLRGYHVYWAAGDDPLDQTTFLAAPTSAFAVTGLQNGEPHRFAIEAENEAGLRSGRSEEVLAVPFDPGDAAPTVTATVPLDGAVDASRNAAIVLTFSLPMDEAATESAWSAEPVIACGFSWNAGRTVLTCLPASNLAPDTSFTVTLGTGARSVAGVPLAAPFSFAFTTGGDLTLTCLFDDPSTSFGACLFAP